MNYAEKLKDPRWQKVRLQVFDRDNWECLRCDCDNQTLHAHHLYYEKGKDPWEYDLKDIVTLCRKCHDKLHSDEEIMQEYTRELRPLNSFENGKVKAFNNFYEAYCLEFSLQPMIDDRYCKSIKAYFSDSEINFTTKKNIIKRLGVYYYYPAYQLAFTLSGLADETTKLILLSQKYVDMETYRYTELGDIIGRTIKIISNREETMYLTKHARKSMKNWEEDISNEFYAFISKKLIDCIYCNQINHTLSFVSVSDLFKFIKLDEEDSIIPDNNYYMWDQEKWIECFDSIDYTPPELLE
ncbi:MAG: HNH endonuclease [Desulfobacterales bacterium]